MFLSDHLASGKRSNEEKKNFHKCYHSLFLAVINFDATRKFLSHSASIDFLFSPEMLTGSNVQHFQAHFVSNIVLSSKFTFK